MVISRETHGVYLLTGVGFMGGGVFYVEHRGGEKRVQAIFEAAGIGAIVGGVLKAVITCGDPKGIEAGIFLGAIFSGSGALATVIWKAVVGG
jgi:hypothetical protein